LSIRVDSVQSQPLPGRAFLEEMRNGRIKDVVVTCLLLEDACLCLCLLAWFLFVCLLFVCLFVCFWFCLWMSVRFVWADVVIPPCIAG
jgi:hypothetical protein